MSAYTEYFLASKSSVVELELLEVSHSAWSKVYRIVRNATLGVTVTLETAAVVSFAYYPLKIDDSGARDDLDTGLTITIGDLGEELPKEMDRVATANAFGEVPKVVYRTYRSDNLAAPLFGPMLLEADNFSFREDGMSFAARAPSLNTTKTGEFYRLERFPMLRGFL